MCKYKVGSAITNKLLSVPNNKFYYVKYISWVKLSRGKDVDPICFVLFWFFPSQKTSLYTRKCFSSLKKLVWLTESFLFSFIPLSENLTRWSIPLKQFVGKSQQIVWVCLNILWGWHLKGYYIYGNQISAMRTGIRRSCSHIESWRAFLVYIFSIHFKNVHERNKTPFLFVVLRYKLQFRVCFAVWAYYLRRCIQNLKKIL